MDVVEFLNIHPLLWDTLAAATLGGIFDELLSHKKVKYCVKT